PPNPKPFTPARRGTPPAFSGHGARADAIRNGERSISSCGSAVWRLYCGGIVRCSNALQILISDAAPEAQPVWPMSALTLPRPTVDAGPRLKTSQSDVTSTLSPTGVAV